MPEPGPACALPGHAPACASPPGPACALPGYAPACALPGYARLTVSCLCMQVDCACTTRLVHSFLGVS